MTTPKPILVTGSHRSGTTWVGRMIASSPSVAYIHEPFAIDNGKQFHKTPFNYWFTYICEQNERQYYRYINDTLNFRCNFISALRFNRRPRFVIKLLINCVQLARYRIAHVRPLLKDPIALFSAEWLSSKFNMDTVVMIRHPAAFVASLKVKNWTFPFFHYINQPLLMKEQLQPFEKEIMQYAQVERNIIDQGALLWNLFHSVILKYQKDHPDWILLRHEDLSRDPSEGFRSLFQNLHLDFSERIANTVKLHSFANNAADMQPVSNFQNVTRDSLANITTWKDRLANSEIERIKSQVQEISREFYTEDEW